LPPALLAALSSPELDALQPASGRVDAAFTLVADTLRDTAAAAAAVGGHAADPASLAAVILLGGSAGGKGTGGGSGGAGAVASQRPWLAASSLDAPEPEEDAHLRGLAAAAAATNGVGGGVVSSGRRAAFLARHEVATDLAAAAQAALGALQVAVGDPDFGALVVARLPPALTGATGR
jgi:hypothetical protein